MIDQGTLRSLREKRFFITWDGEVDSEHIESAEDIMRQLVDALLAGGTELTEDIARANVDACVQRFNELDDGWICTIEREDICEQIENVIDACGYDFEEDWRDKRDW